MKNLKEINGKYYQECNVVMLVTGKDGAICINSNDKMFDKNYSDTDNYHLYFLSNEEIKIEDWYIFHWSNEISIQQFNEFQLKDRKEFPSTYRACKKIISTTDRSLTMKIKIREEHTDPVSFYYPQPSKQFIQKYIEEYNKGNTIEKVLVEYQIVNINHGTNSSHKYEPELKVDSHNCITIKPIKDSYTKEEVEKLCENAYDSGRYSIINQEPVEISNFYNWIKENL